MTTESALGAPQATLTYQQCLERLAFFFDTTIQAIDQSQLARAAGLLTSARRIFCVGSGSSVATAWHIASTLCAQGGLASSFMSTSQLVGMTSLTSEDVLVLVSQGYNRSDSAIATRTARLKGVRTIVLSAYQGQIEADAVIRFTPTAEEERLFCRPCGAITSFVTGAILAARCLQREVHLEELRNGLHTESLLWRSGKSHKQVAKLLNSASLVIVLGSGSLLPVLHNTALSLREGAGLVAEFFEIEYYAHGQYAPHYRHHDSGGRVVYLLGEASADPISTRSVERILPLMEKTGALHEVFTAQGGAIAAMVSILSVVNQLVYSAIVESKYDMNNPRGKEENRGFQLVGASYYE